MFRQEASYKDWKKLLAFHAQVSTQRLPGIWMNNTYNMIAHSVEENRVLETFWGSTGTGLCRLMWNNCLKYVQENKGIHEKEVEEIRRVA